MVKAESLRATFNNNQSCALLFKETFRVGVSFTKTLLSPLDFIRFSLTNLSKNYLIHLLIMMKFKSKLENFRYFFFEPSLNLQWCPMIVEIVTNPKFQWPQDDLNCKPLVQNAAT